MKQAMLAALGVALVGCSGGGAQEEKDVASMTLSLVADPSFVGNSVKICGRRADVSDAKYPCRNHLGPSETDQCECFNFNEVGGLDEVLPDLCPSNNADDVAGLSSWTFTYAIYSAADCSEDAEILNDGAHNFACYDMSQLDWRDQANTTVEYLEPGCNENEITCLTRNAIKAFDFDVCVLVEDTQCPDQHGDFSILCEDEDFCGDDSCNGDETLGSCPQDCAHCGDGICTEGEEDVYNCAEDCAECGDGICSPGVEDAYSCPQDCAQCGDTICTIGEEDCGSCPADCGACCGDGSCEADHGETCSSCSADCGVCPPSCDDGACNGDETCLSCPADCGPCPMFRLDCGCEGQPAPTPPYTCICPETFEAPDGCFIDTSTMDCFVVCPGEAPVIATPADQ